MQAHGILRKTWLPPVFPAGVGQSKTTYEMFNAFQFVSYLLGLHGTCLSTSSVNPPNPGPYDLSLSTRMMETTATAPSTGINAIA